MSSNYNYVMETSKEITEKGLLNLIARTFDVDTAGLTVENIESFTDENGDNYVITCSKEEGDTRTIKVFHAYG